MFLLRKNERNQLCNRIRPSNKFLNLFCKKRTFFYLTKNKAFASKKKTSVAFGPGPLTLGFWAKRGRAEGHRALCMSLEDTIFKVQFMQSQNSIGKNRQGMERFSSIEQKQKTLFLYRIEANKLFLYFCIIKTDKKEKYL